MSFFPNDDRTSTEDNIKENVNKKVICRYCGIEMESIGGGKFLCPKCKDIFPPSDIPEWDSKFEEFENLLASTEDTEFYAVRGNLIDRYGVDVILFERGTNKLVCCVQAQRDNTGTLFEGDGKVHYDKPHVPARVVRFVNLHIKENPIVFIHGNMESNFCYVLCGYYIHGNVKDTVTFDAKIKGEIKRDSMLDFSRNDALKKVKLYFGPIPQWINFVRFLYFSTDDTDSCWVV